MASLLNALTAGDGPFQPSWREDGSRALWRRTLILLRWVAVAGQSAAVLVATLWLNVQAPLVACVALIGVAASYNLAATLLQGDRGRLSEPEAFMSLLFDLSQLVALLYITGGLSNPFAVLMIAPVTISAVALSQKITLALGAAAIVAASALAVWHVPLVTEAGAFSPPPLWLAGFWVAIVLGVAFQAFYVQLVSNEATKMSAALSATQMALEREQRLAAVGSLAAAAAHELGTPLATIKVTAGELRRDLDGQTGSLSELADDAALISEQATRCRKILERLSATNAPDDKQMRVAPISTVIETAAAPHRGRHADIKVRVAGRDAASAAEQIHVYRRPEIIHGLRNLIENAVDYASTTVWIDVETTDEAVSVTISDDGPGFAPDVLSTLGDPFTTTRGRTPKSEDDRHGLGLGVFISTTLLERSGAVLTFYNRGSPPDRPATRARPRGAAVSAAWPRASIEAKNSHEEDAIRAEPVARNTLRPSADAKTSL